MIPSLYDPIEIEARIQPPTRAEGEGGDVYFVITHPFGPMGGNMYNNVVASLHDFASGGESRSRTGMNIGGGGGQTKPSPTPNCSGLGYGTCRFNFR